MNRKLWLPKRSRPHHEIVPIPNRHIIVLITVCTKNRQPWLAAPEVHEILISVWREATAWLVGRYVIMPDHIHLFASPRDETVSLESWVRYWKSQFSKRHKNPNHRWQVGYWDTTLRSNESYDEKWDYVHNNPVRHGLVSRPEDWPYQGEIFVLEW
jgi:REP element-mobilizing transposase RayT